MKTLSSYCDLISCVLLLSFTMEGSPSAPSNNAGVRSSYRGGEPMAGCSAAKSIRGLGCEAKPYSLVVLHQMRFIITLEYFHNNHNGLIRAVFGQEQRPGTRQWRGLWEGPPCPKWKCGGNPPGSGQELLHVLKYPNCLIISRAILPLCFFLSQPSSIPRLETRSWYP